MCFEELSGNTLMHRWEPSNIFNPCMTQAPVLKRSWSLWYEHWFLLSRQKKQYWYWCYISIIIKKSFSQVICWHLASFLKWGSLNLGSRPWRTKASVQPHFESEAVWIQDRGHCGRKQAFNHSVITNAKLKKCALHFVIERWFFSLFDDANFAVGSRLWILWLISTCHSVNWKLLILVYIK